MTKWHGGKGDSYRQVNQSRFDAEFDRIFKKDAKFNHYCVQGGHTTLSPEARCDWCGDNYQEDNNHEVRTTNNTSTSR